MAYELYVGSEYMGVDRGDKIGTYGVSEGLGFVGVGILYLMGLYGCRYQEAHGTL